MFKIANRHPDFAAAPGYKIGDRSETDLVQHYAPHAARTFPVHDASAQWLQDRSGAGLVREMEQ